MAVPAASTFAPMTGPNPPTNRPSTQLSLILPPIYRALFTIIEVRLSSFPPLLPSLPIPLLPHLSHPLTSFQPTIIILALISIPISPASHFHSLAPPESRGRLFSLAPADDHPLLTRCDAISAWHTPQLRVLWYQFMAALAFSAVIEPVLLAFAVPRLESLRDAQMVIRAVLLAFAAFDVLHAAATVAVTGFEAVVPVGERGWGGVDGFAVVNFWVPVVWLGIRGGWLMGIGRGDAFVKGT